MFNYVGEGVWRPPPLRSIELLTYVKSVRYAQKYPADQTYDKQVLPKSIDPREEIDSPTNRK